MSKARNLSLLSTVEAGATTDQTKADLNAIGVNSGRKNIITNGSMNVAQRGPSFTGNTSGNRFTADRFKAQLGSAGTFTFNNSSTAPEGFSNSSHMNCTTAFSVASGTYLLFSHNIEGRDLQQAAFGTSSAKQMTVSFWCRSTKTGSLSVVVRQEDASQRMFSKNVTINTANTWEKKSVVIPADTGGTINNDSGSGLQIAWWVNGGSTYGGGSEQTTWGNQTHTNKYTGTLNIGASTADNFYLTGVQLEVGSVATDFEHRSYGENLLACQRYYAKNAAAIGVWVTTTTFRICGQFNTTMRANPSISRASNTGYHEVWNLVAINGFSAGSHYGNSKGFDVACSSTGTVSSANVREFALMSPDCIQFDAEL